MRPFQTLCTAPSNGPRNMEVEMIREINSEETGKLYECLEALAEHHNKVSVHFYEKYGFRERSVILTLER